MTSEREPEARKGIMFRSSDLEEVKEAVSQLRALSPNSALADLVEEKMRAIENDCSLSRLDLSPPQEGRLFG